MEDKLFTIEEVMAYLKVSRKTLYRYMNSSALEYQFVGERRRISQEAIAKFMKPGKPKEPKQATDQVVST